MINISPRNHAETLLSSKGIVIKIHQQPYRHDGLMNIPNASHWGVAFKIKGKSIPIGVFTQGPAVKRKPKELEVLASFVWDARLPEEYEDWEQMCEEMGYLEQGREGIKKARRIWYACKDTQRRIHEIFSEGELETLMDLFDELGY